MTTPRRDGQGTPFGRWLRTVSQLDSIEQNMSATDVDMWIHKYTPRNERRNTGDFRSYVDLLMLVEVKTNNSELHYAQRDTLQVIKQICEVFFKTPGGRRRIISVAETRVGFQKTRYVKWCGVHLLQLSTDCPTTSEIILWDKNRITLTRLIELLGFEYDPDHPFRKMETRRHHYVREVQLPLLSLVSK